MLRVTVPDTQLEVDKVGEGGRVPLTVSDTLPVPLPPTSVVVRVPVPRGALPEKVCVTVKLRLPEPLQVPPLGVGG